MEKTFTDQLRNLHWQLMNKNEIFNYLAQN